VAANSVVIHRKPNGNIPRNRFIRLQSRRKGIMSGNKEEKGTQSPRPWVGVGRLMEGSCQKYIGKCERPTLGKNGTSHNKSLLIGRDLWGQICPGGRPEGKISCLNVQEWGPGVDDVTLTSSTRVGVDEEGWGPPRAVVMENAPEFRLSMNVKEA